MKLKYLIAVFIGMITALAILLIQPARAQSAIASHEFWIEVNTSTNLNCNRIRVTSGSFVMDQSPTNWVLRFPIEAWRTNGTTTVISRDQLELSMAELTTLMNAGNKLTAFKNAVKAKVNLVEKP